jgi:hypothetical protein
MSTLTVEGLCNQALDMIGFKGRRIGSIYDGTPAARVALEAYSFTRDQLLNLEMPYWAQRMTPLTLIDAAADDYEGLPWTPSTPPLDYKYSYDFPDDCVQPLLIMVTPVLRPIWKPKYIPFDVYSPSPTTRWIVTNAPNAMLVYTGQVNDPNLWQEDFTLKLVTALAQKFQAKLGAARVEQHPDDTGGRGQSGAG